MIAEGKHLAVKLAQVFQLTRGGSHPPYVLLCAADLRQVELHIIVVVIVNQQIVVATGGDKTIVLLPVFKDNALVTHTLEVGEGENEPFQVLHLVEARVLQSLVPRLHITCVAIAGGITGLQHLHDGVMAVGMSA